MNTQIWAVILILVTAGVGAFGFILSKFWGYAENLMRETHKNTMAIMELTLQLKMVGERLVSIPKMERDINSLHEKFRVLRKDPKGET